MSRSARSCSTVARRGSACRLKGRRLPAQAVVVRADYAPLCFLLLPERPAQGQTRPKTNFLYSQLIAAVEHCAGPAGAAISPHTAARCRNSPGARYRRDATSPVGITTPESHVRITIRPLGGGRTGILSPRPPSGTGTIVRHKRAIDRLVCMGSSTSKMRQAVSFPELFAAAAPVCPKCTKPMKPRSATRPDGDVYAFWGCVAFPKCLGTRTLR